MAAEILTSPEGKLHRSSSETDIFPANSARPRTCSNVSLRNKPSKNVRKRPTSLKEKELASQNSIGSESELGLSPR